MRLFRHVKTGRDYEMLHEEAYAEQTGVELVVYRSLSTNVIWIRPKSEFFDGRFKEIK